jgi:uncharacterized UPF0146 family protein
MSVAGTRERVRARAARSPLLRKLAGKPPLYATAPEGPNPSAERVPDDSLWRIADRYEGSFPLPPVAYGTVRDFADSSDHIPGLADTNFDMKDMQRCWAVKAVLGNVERGSKVLEIGAGEPLVAGLLARLGYDVTTVDPYDGTGNGPREYSLFKKAYDDVHVVRDRFPPQRPLGDDFAAVYSISVLEHVPLDAIDSLLASGRDLVSRGGGCQIHAVDHVVAGWGAQEHLEKLRRMVAALGLSDQDLAAALAELEGDPETYFVSADAHNRWRGKLPYDSYPMRRIASVNLFATAGRS